MTAMLPPIIGGIQAAFEVGTKMCFTFFTMQIFANFLFFQNITNFARSEKYFGEKIKIFRKMRNQNSGIKLSTLTALLLETSERRAALSGRLANKPIQ
jgi:hypothetical protein